MRLDPDEAWGYVTSGGTEGNLYGLYLAREMFPNGIFYFSEETHYSVLKNLRVLNARYVMIKRQDDGEIDYQDLQDMVRVNRDLPAVIIANIGTTMRGAVDDIERIKEILRGLGVTHSYLHADAALSGMILPFVPEPQAYGFDGRHRQDRGERPQTDRGAAAVRCRADSPRQRGTGRPHHRARRNPGTPPCPARATA